MKTVTINDLRPTVGRVAVSTWLLGLGLSFLIPAVVLQAAVNVTTLGGGPLTLTDSGAGNANGGTFRDSQFNNPVGMALDSVGNLYVADSSNNSVRKITKPGNNVESITSTLITNSVATAVPAPVAITIDRGDNLYVLTQGDGAIRKYSKTGTPIATITLALTSPTALAMDSQTNFFVTELGGAVKRITSSGVVTTIAPTGTFLLPRGIAFFDTNNLAISDTGKNAIKLMNLATPIPVPVTLAGDIGGAAGFADGDADTAQFNSPWQLTIAPNGSLIIADRGNHRVRALTPEGTVATVYGVDTNEWVAEYFPGYQDGTNAHAKLPAGVLVGPFGTNIFVTEQGYHLIRQAGGFSFAAAVGGTPSGGGITNNSGTVPQNVISFGFASGEGSSLFVGAPGQKFFAPITLTLPLAQQVYSLGFSVAVTNDFPSPPVVSGAFGFKSMLVKPVPGTTFFTTIEPQFSVGRTTNVINLGGGVVVTNIIPIFTNSVFTNASKNLLGVAWLETIGSKDLYDTTSQDLIKFSQAHANQFNPHQSGKVILGAYGYQIPTNSVVGNTYRIRVFNASGTSNLTDKVVFTAPTNGLVSSLKTLRVATNSYLVGDINPFRWLNAGDFGDNTIDIADAQETFTAAMYGINTPPEGSDFWDAMNSSDGSTNTITNPDAILIGDKVLDVNDVLVTLRRALDPASKWIVRFRSPTGVLSAREGTNTLEQPFSAATLAKSVVVGPQATSTPTAVTFSADDAVVGSSRTITVPIRVHIAGDLFNSAFKMSRLMLGVTVKPLDGAPDLTSPIQFTQTANLGSRSFTTTRGANNYATAWLNIYNSSSLGLLAGSSVIGNLTITVPANAASNAAYLVHFDHASVCPSAVLETHIVDGLITLSDRSGSTLGDAIPDSWRLKHFGTAYNLQSGADVDADGDGISNWAEFKAGTNPNDQNSRLKMQAGSAADLAVRWPTVVGKNYMIDGSTSLFGSSWVPVSATIPGTGQLMEFRPTPTGAAQFYRVRLVD